MFACLHRCGARVAAHAWQRTSGSARVAARHVRGCAPGSAAPARSCVFASACVCACLVLCERCDVCSPDALAESHGAWVNTGTASPCDYLACGASSSEAGRRNTAQHGAGPEHLLDSDASGFARCCLVLVGFGPSSGRTWPRVGAAASTSRACLLYHHGCAGRDRLGLRAATM